MVGIVPDSLYCLQSWAQYLAHSRHSMTTGEGMNNLCPWDTGKWNSHLEGLTRRWVSCLRMSLETFCLTVWGFTNCYQDERAKGALLRFFANIVLCGSVKRMVGSYNNSGNWERRSLGWYPPMETSQRRPSWLRRPCIHYTLSKCDFLAMSAGPPYKDVQSSYVMGTLPSELLLFPTQNIK